MQKVDVNLVEEGARGTQTKESALAKLLVRFIIICLILAHLERELLAWLPSRDPLPIPSISSIYSPVYTGILIRFVIRIDLM